jgi:hypothetical protein
VRRKYLGFPVPVLVEPEDDPDVVESMEVVECLLEIAAFIERNDPNGFA